MQETIILIVILLATTMVVIGMPFVTLISLLGFAVVAMSTVRHPGLLPIGRLPYRKRLERAYQFQKFAWLTLGEHLTKREEEPLSTYSLHEGSPRALLYWLHHWSFFSPGCATALVVLVAVEPWVGYVLGLLVLSYLILEFSWWMVHLSGSPYKKELREELANELAGLGYVMVVTPGYYLKRLVGYFIKYPEVLGALLLVAVWATLGTSQTTVLIAMILGIMLMSWLSRALVAALFQAVFRAPGYLRPIYRFCLVPLGKASRYLGELFFGAYAEVQELRGIPSLNLGRESALCVSCPQAIIYHEAAFSVGYLETAIDFAVGMPIYLRCLTPCEEWEALYGAKEESVPAAQTA